MSKVGEFLRVDGERAREGARIDIDVEGEGSEMGVVSLRWRCEWRGKATHL